MGCNFDEIIFYILAYRLLHPVYYERYYPYSIFYQSKNEENQDNHR